MRGALPAGDWVLHATRLLGGLTDRWIDLQARMGEKLETRLMGAKPAATAEPEPHWLVAGEGLGGRLAYEWMDRSRGLSLAPLAAPLRHAPPPIVHAHYGPTAAQHRYFARLLDSPLVASFYGWDATQSVFRSPRWRRQYRKLFEYASTVIVEGPAMAERVERLGCSAAKLRVIRMPADADGLARCRRPKADHFRVVVAGRFIEKKGFDTAIRAFARALKGKEAHLLVAGGGPLEPSLRRLVRSEGIESQVKWSSRAPFHEFMSGISEARVALFPSRTDPSGDSEGGAPVTLIEAQWLGVPAIVSDHDDLPFVAPPGSSIVLPALDIDGWADALRALYDDAQRLDAMAREAEAFAKANHDPATNLAAREAVYVAAK